MRAFVCEVDHHGLRRLVPEDLVPGDELARYARTQFAWPTTVARALLDDGDAEDLRAELLAGRRHAACGLLLNRAVELVGLSHERAADLDVWLESPDGTVVTLLSDVGGDGPLEAASVLIDASGPSAGEAPFGLRASPSDRQSDRQRKGAPPPADLALFAGTDPDGEWQLLVADDRPARRGDLESWTLILSS